MNDINIEFQLAALDCWLQHVRVLSKRRKEVWFPAFGQSPPTTCGSACDSLKTISVQSYSGTLCTDTVSLLCVSSCEPPGCLSVQMTCGIPGTDTVSLLCGSSCDWPSLTSDRSSSHKTGTDTVSPPCGSSHALLKSLSKRSTWRNKDICRASAPSLLQT